MQRYLIKNCILSYTNVSNNKKSQRKEKRKSKSESKQHKRSKNLFENGFEVERKKRKLEKKNLSR